MIYNCEAVGYVSLQNYMSFYCENLHKIFMCLMLFHITDVTTKDFRLAGHVCSAIIEIDHISITVYCIFTHPSCFKC